MRRWKQIIRRWLAGLAAGGMLLYAQGWFDVRGVDPDGSVAWTESVPNGACTAGLTDLLSQGFNAGTQRTTWYVGLIANAGFSALSAADTMASHAGWAEATTFNEATRVQWTPLTAAAGSIVNTAVCTFTMNSTAVIYGVFVTTGSAISGTAGILWATGAFSTPRTPSVAQLIQVTYRTTLTG